jgi:hypothetical protein
LFTIRYPEWRYHAPRETVVDGGGDEAQKPSILVLEEKFKIRKQLLPLSAIDRHTKPKVKRDIHCVGDAAFKYFMKEKHLVFYLN